MEFVTLDEYPNYEIHSTGKVFRIKKETNNGKILKRRELFPTRAKNGYRTVKLTNKDGKIKQLYLHRLVYMAFNGEIPPGLEVSHKDCNRSNNRLENLEAVTHKENCSKEITRAKSNALSAGKFNRERMMQAKSQENKERLRREYVSMLKETGSVRVCDFLKKAHCNFYTALRIRAEVEGKNDVNL